MDINTPYSSWKFVHHPDVMRELQAGSHPSPVQVHFVISDTCNHRCSFCAYRWDGYQSAENFLERDADGKVTNFNPKRQIPTDKAFEILDDCARMGVRAIQYTGGGEPLMHPEHARLFKRTLALGMDLALVTNGSLLTVPVMDLLGQAHWVRVSLDAATPHTYSELRRVGVGQFDKTVANIKQLVKVQRRPTSRSDLLVGVGFVVGHGNYHEAVDAIKLCADLGVDNVRISAAFTPEGIFYHSGYYEQLSEDLREAVAKYARPDFHIFNLFGDRIEDLKQRSPDYQRCYMMQLVPYIGADLNVYRCCMLAYNDQGLLGSIAERSFQALWQSDEVIADFAGFDAHDCPPCMFNRKNDFIGYCVVNDPQHVNFI